MPDNCKNFSGTFHYRPKARSSKDLEHQRRRSKPPRRHPLVLAYRFQHLLDTAVVNTQADLARRLGVSRARITQILSLLKLPAEIQEQILRLPEKEQRYFTERKLREIIRLDSSKKQHDAFAGLVGVIAGARECSPRRTGP